MKKKALLASAALAVLGASAGYGAVVTTVTNLGVPNDGLGANGYGPLAGYHAYKVTLTADAGQKITAVDFSTQGGAGKVLTGQFHQYWTLNKNSKTGTITVVNSSPNSTAGANNAAPDPNFPTSAYDSHFIFDPLKVNAGEAAQENNDVQVGASPATGQGTSPFSPLWNVNAAGGTPSDGWGQGSTLSVAFGIQGDFQTQVTDVAYLVIPDSFHLTQSRTLATGLIGATNSGASPDTSTVIIPALVPEPASLAMLGLGAGLFIRRRKA